MNTTVPGLILEPAWNTFFLRTRLSRTLKIRMRLVPEKNEVRAVDEQWDVTWAGNTPRLAIAAEQSRGQVKTVSKRWSVGRGEDGGMRRTEIFDFDTAQLKDPLREAVLAAGWTWRGVVFKL
ncbi:hypothetical protein ACFXKW_20700 [Streptomyces sp. NPDC059193]|uniref:hypothetical protein n=1 Tax=Streptomyces sp. NPDC059193 TaxID=3346763 RepID=UPI00367F33F9